tara:strand:+ start:66 stop:1640 length:1575 start_codon:yes stop_codon:yes gene_type:complete
MVVAVVGGAAAGAEEPLRMVRVATDTPAALAAELHAHGLDVEHGHTYQSGDGGGLEIVVTAAEQAWLAERGHAVRVVRTGQPLRDGGREAGRGIPDGYGDLDWIYQQMHAAAARRPDVCEVVDLTERYGADPTFEGRHLFAVRISDNVGQDEAEPAVLIVANHHAREIGTPIVALRTIDNLVDGYGSDPRITAAVDGHEIWIAPTWNPDGYHHVYTVDDFWRKNRRPNPDGSRGVDLNRNYPVGWGQCGGSTFPGSSVYQGPEAASEPETRTMVAFAADRRFARVADIHSYASEVRYGYGCWNHPWDPSFGQVAAGLSQLSGYGGDTGSSCCLGGDIHLHTNRYGALAFLWEIGTSFHPSFASANAEADVLWNAMIELIDRGSAISGRVMRAGSQTPVEATVTVVGAGFSHGETHGSAPRHGLFHAHPPLGTWTLRFEAAGYEPAERTVTLNSVMPQAALLVELTPECAADLAEPFGVLNFFDLSAFIGLYGGQDPAADWAAPAGVFNFFDVAAYIGAYNAGCP